MNAQAVTRRAYSTLEWKSVDDEKRIIEGVASTPSVDRMGDTVNPKGAQFSLPIPFLWQHDTHQPIGHVTAAKATSSGIKFTAQIARGVTPKIDEAWALIKAGLVRGISIGFRPLDVERIKDSLGINILSWEWLEASAVTIPANQDASIQVIKSIDQAILAATGRKESRDRTHPPGASGFSKTKTREPPEEGKKVKTFQEQIADYTSACASRETQMKGMIDAVGGVDKLDGEQAEEYDRLNAEQKKDKASLDRLSVFTEKAATAKPLPETPNFGHPRVQVIQPPKLEKGILFARYAMAVLAGKGSISDTLEYAKQWNAQTPEVSAHIKAVAGTSVEASPGWGSQLVFQNNLTTEFIELLRAAAIIGRINGFRRVPFNVRIAAQTAGGTVNWVGEGASKPVTDQVYDEVTLPYHKIAGIVHFTEELARLSQPSVEVMVRDDLVAGISAFMDQQFLDPTITATSSRPASITQGVTGNPATGADADSLYADLNTALATFDNAETNQASLVIVMRKNLARGISTLRNAMGQFEFAQVTPNGGTLVGYQVVVSNSAPDATIVILNPRDILMADDGAVRLDASNQATIDPSGGDSPTTSFWQRNLIGIRAERWITYKKARPTAVEIITSAAYGPA